MGLSFFHAIYIFEIVGIATVVSIVLGPLGIKLARQFGLIDVPGSFPHKQHENPTALAGGIVLVLSTLFVISIFRLWADERIRAILIAGLLIFIFGLWDDARGFSATQKLLGQILASILLIWLGVSVNFLKSLEVGVGFLNEDILALLNWGITIFWLVAASNAFNLIDSMDGLAIGITGIAFAFFVVISFASEQPSLSALSAGLLGICVGLYFYNISPARLFLGDSGSQTLGFILASIAILYSPQNLPQTSSWFVPILLLGVPIFDTTLVIFSRLYRRKPVFQSDLGHTYHRLIALGLSSRRAVLVMHMAALLLSCLGIIALSMTPLVSNILFFVIVLTGFSVLVFLGRKPINNPLAKYHDETDNS